MSRQQVLAALQKRGVPAHIAQGIAGNIAVESGFDPGINEISPVVPGSRGGFGLFQHTGPRRRALEAFAQQSGRPLADIDTQIDFALQELQTTERGAADALFKTQTAEDAARVFSERFLRPGVPHLDRRIAAATGGDVSGGSGTPSLLGSGGDDMANGQQRRGGLLGLLSGNQPQTGQTPGIVPEQGARRQGGLLGEGGVLGPDRRDRLILALEGMTLNPNVALQQTAAQGIQQRAQQRQTTQQRSQTGEFLRQRGHEDLAKAVETGAIPAQVAVQTALAPPPDDRTALIKNFEFARQNGFQGSFEDYLGITKGGTTVNIAGEPQVGTIPPGFQLEKDDETGAFRMTPIPGGPADTEAQEIAQAAAAALETGEIKRSVVDDQIDLALKLMDRKGALDLPEAGIVGAALAGLGVNQEAVDLKNTLAGIQATVAFDTLQKMREASKTGGALGAVSERELDLLISSYGALQQSTSPEILRNNLQTVKRIMGKIANDPVASRFLSGGSVPQATGQAQAPAAAPQGNGGGFVIRGRID